MKISDYSRISKDKKAFKLLESPILKKGEKMLDIHYDSKRFGYLGCQGEECKLCNSIGKSKKVKLVPVYDYQTKEVKIIQFNYWMIQQFKHELNKVCYNKNELKYKDGIDSDIAISTEDHYTFDFDIRIDDGKFESDVSNDEVLGTYLDTLEIEGQLLKAKKLKQILGKDFRTVFVSLGLEETLKQMISNSKNSIGDNSLAESKLREILEDDDDLYD